MNLLNELAIGKTIEFEDGIQRTIVEKLPHQDIKNAYYYKFDDGLIERDVRIHGRIVSNQVQAVVVPNEEIGGGHLTDKEFETLSVRITPAFYDIDLDGATNCKGDVLRKLRIIINDIIDSRQLEPPVILAKGGQLHIKIYRDDNIEGFAAYCAQDKNETKTILMNVYATFAASVENDIDAKEFIIQNLMHEFGHALEEYYEKEFDEDFIEKAVQTYFDKYHPDSPLSK